MIDSERAYIEKVAREYEAAGYTTVIEPGRDRLPSGFPYVPDLLAERGADRVVVEVTRAGRGRATERWGDLGAAVERLGWHFRLIVLADDETDAVQYESVSPKEIAARLASAETLAPTQLEAAVLLAWAGFEAAARRAVLLREQTVLRTSNTLGLVKLLVHHGVLDEEDLKTLAPIAQRRNALAHGVPTSQVAESDVARLAELGRQLLAA